MLLRVRKNSRLPSRFDTDSRIVCANPVRDAIGNFIVKIRNVEREGQGTYGSAFT